MKKDWTGNALTAFACNGASNHSEGERQVDDYYATEPRALELLLEVENFSKNIWECACGGGHLSNVLINAGHSVKSTDLVYRGFGTGGVDFFRQTEKFDGDILTNPPYKYAREFVEKALSLVEDGNKVAMFLKLTFLESKSRRSLFKESPPKRIWVSSSRLQCVRNGDFTTYKAGVGTAIAYAWYIWEKGFKGDPAIKWFN